MNPNQATFLQRLVSNSALAALVVILVSETLNALARLLPSPLRPAPLWPDSSGTDLDEQRTAARGTNRRITRTDRRRNPGFRPLGLYSLAEPDRRVLSRGRRATDWRFS